VNKPWQWYKFDNAKYKLENGNYLHIEDLNLGSKS
jgi:hypothetical protein